MQAFTLGQNPRWMALALVLGGMFKYGRLAGEPPMLGELLRAYRVGKTGRFLMTARWEELWETPLSQLRQEFGMPALA